MSRTYIALDIRDHSICALLLKSSLKGISIEGQTEVLLEPAGEGENPWLSAISAVKERLDTRGAVCLVSFPPALASYRNLTVPFDDRRKIRQVLPFEVEPLLPYPLDEVTIDFQTVRQGETTEIIAVAVEQQKLQQILDALAAFRLNPQLIIPGGFAVGLCLCRHEPGDPVLYIDIDASTATIFAIASGSIYLVRSVYMGSAPEALRIRTLKSHIQRLLMAFETIHSFDFVPKRICVSGRAMTVGAIEKAVPASLDLPVERVDMSDLSEIRVESAIDKERRDAANNPLALAFVDLHVPDSLNFYQQRHALYHYWEAHKVSIVKTAVGALLVFVLAMSGLIYDIQRLQARVEKLEAEKISLFRSTFPGVTRIEDPYLQMQINVRESRGKDQFAGLRESGVLNIDILNDLSRLIPPDIEVVMTRFVRGQGSVLLSGHTDTFNAVDDIKGALDASEFFSEITISSANMDKSNNRVQFKLKLELPPAG